MARENAVEPNDALKLLQRYALTFAAWLLAHWTIISGVVVGGLSWATTGNSTAFWSAVASGLVAHGGATAGANSAFKAHLAKAKVS